MRNEFFLLVSFVLTRSFILTQELHSHHNDEFDNPISLNLAISSRYRKLELVWANVPLNESKFIIITNRHPQSKHFNKTKYSVETSSTSVSKEWEQNQNTSVESNATSSSSSSSIAHFFKWQFGTNNEDVLLDYEVDDPNGWFTTTLIYHSRYGKFVNLSTKCYAFWIFLINENGTILAESCLKAHPTWMNDIRENIENFRLRDLFIPGTHDSVAYRYDFDPNENETLVTKYAVTQEDDIQAQLMHGVRYLDIRVGYYKFLNTQFWGNHGISRQQPLYRVLKQVRDFVLETNEIVILDFQEFPVGFGKGLDIHRKLVELIERDIGDILIRDLPWSATLKTLWATNKNIIVAYDHNEIQKENPSILWQAVEQKWGNVQSLEELRKYLNKITHELASSFSSRPKASMAELTPQVWGVVTDQYGGLRVLADKVNRHISKWYRDEWGTSTNIVAADFIRGTTLVDTAITQNLRKGSYVPLRYDIIT